MQLLTIIGARPQFVKASVVSKALEQTPEVSETVIHTGQHFDQNMSEIFFEELGLPSPDKNLGIGGGSHGQNTGRMIEAIESLLIDNKPDCVLVYGDTDSTLAGALAATKLNIPVAHVEAGLRSGDRSMPEEINRILTDHCSTLHFTPTATASENLNAEGIRGNDVHECGDVMLDAVRLFQKSARQPDGIDCCQPFVLATIHRAENTDQPYRLNSIVAQLLEIAQLISVVLPLHPRTRARMTDAGLDLGNLTVVDPVGYLETLWLLKNCSSVITDSGGLQKEAVFLGKSCLVVRSRTEWVELLTTGLLRVVNLDIASSFFSSTASNNTPPSWSHFGDGHASTKIATVLAGLATR